MAASERSDTLAAARRDSLAEHAAALGASQPRIDQFFQPVQPELTWWKAATAVEGQRYKHVHKRYGEVVVVAIKVPSENFCQYQVLCRCGCGMRAQHTAKHNGYAMACYKRESVKAAVMAARDEDGKLPEYRGKHVEVAGVYCRVNNREGQAVKNGDSTKWKPFCACGVCFRLTQSSGMLHAPGCETAPRCTTVTRGVRCTNGRSVGELCAICYARKKYPPCPGGCGWGVPEGLLCMNCKSLAAKQAKRDEHTPALLELIAAGARDGREVNPWDDDVHPGVLYVVHNDHDEHRANLVLRTGNAWTTACRHRHNGVLCNNKARHTKGETALRCIRHGGGPRCESGAHDPDDGVAPWAGFVVSEKCVSVPLRGKQVCMHCLRRLDSTNIAVKLYVKKEDMVLAGVGECLIELGRGELCIGRRARMVQDCATGASRRRMDADVPLPTDLVICDVENDEDQHDGREQSCENRKLSGHYIDKGAPQEVGAPSKPVPKLYVLRFNCDGYTDDQGKKHPSLFNRSGIQSEDELLKLEPVNPRFKAACMLLALAIVELYDNCTRPEFIEGLKEWTVVYLRYDGCRADGTDPGGVAEAVAQRVVGGKAKARIEAYKTHAKAKKAARNNLEAGPSGAYESDPEES